MAIGSPLKKELQNVFFKQMVLLFHKSCTKCLTVTVHTRRYNTFNGYETLLKLLDVAQYFKQQEIIYRAVLDWG